MASTVYEVVRAGKVVDTRSSKEAAIKLATKPGDQVRTQAGTVVHEAKARRVMRKDRFSPFTRVDSREFKELLGEGVRVPANFEIAYLRPRQGFAMLRHVGEDKRYLLFNLQSGDKHEVESCRDSAQLVKSLAAKAAKKKTGVKKGHLESVAS